MVTITRNPRTNIEVRRNYCSAPIGAGYAQTTGWSSLGVGAMDTSGAGVIVKSWSSAPGAIQGSGIRYRDDYAAPGEWRHIVFSAYVNGYTAKLVITCEFYDASNNLIILVNSDPVTMFSGFTSTMEGLFQAPAGTKYVNVSLVHAAGSGLPGAGNGIAFSRVLIESGTTTGLARYFDGSTYAGGSGSLSTYWTATAGFSQSVMQDWDPANIIAPAISEGWDQVNPSGNTFFDLLDFTSGAVLAVSGPRRGTFRLLFGDVGSDPALARAAAVAATVQLSQGVTYLYSDTSLGGLGSMLFAVAGDVRLYVSDSRQTWRVDVPYREL